MKRVKHASLVEYCQKAARNVNSHSICNVYVYVYVGEVDRLDDKNVRPVIDYRQSIIQTRHLRCLPILAGRFPSRRCSR